jgi:uncharacterized protein with ATP-grasp and redox domains
MNQPPLEPLPEPLRGTEPDSFAYYTITVRFPRIINQVLHENDLPAGQQAALKELLSEIPAGSLRPLRDIDSPDTGQWSVFLEPYRGQNWFQTPWFLCETYFFRRIIEAIRFYEKGPAERPDPYRKQKESNLDETLADLSKTPQRLPVDTASDLKSALQAGLILGLWGNQTDLSMWPAGSDQGPSRMGNPDDSHLLVDASAAIADYLAQGQRPRIDIILDNAGAELTYDLLLADLLITSRLQATVHLHAKPHPTYVSDATAHDVQYTVTTLQESGHPGLQAAGQRLSNALLSNRLQIQADYFWTSPLSGWQMPAALYEDLAKAYLILSKGDANYRRLLGDRHWPFTTPFSEITRYRPAPLAALRVLKSEVACGLEPNQAAQLHKKDPTWLIDGRWGVIQFAY